MKVKSRKEALFIKLQESPINECFSLKQFERMNPYSEQHGLVFRSFVYLFKLLQERQDCNFVLKASFLEIYNEKVSGYPVEREKSFVTDLQSIVYL